ELIPALADSIIPTFFWDAFPQTKEYIIEVRDINGNLIWGGFNENGEIRHAQIPKELNNIEFNFDGSALAQPQSGSIYQWRIYSDDDAAPNVQTLLSSSEDLMGLFIAPCSILLIKTLQPNVIYIDGKREQNRFYKK